MASTLPIEFQAARLRLSRERPYLNSALWALRPVEDPNLGTMAVDDGWRLYFDPEVVKKWSPEETVGVFYHEVNHMLRDHSARGKAGSYHPYFWNLAADAAINDDLIKENGVVLPNCPKCQAILTSKPKRGRKKGDVIGCPDHPTVPKTCVLPSSLWGAKDGLLEEEYYDHIMKNVKFIKAVQCPTCNGAGQVPKQDKGGSGGQGDKQDQQGGGQSGQQGQQGQDQKGSGHGQGGTQPCPDCGGSGVVGEHGERVIPIPGGGNCGSVADGHHRHWEHEGGKESNGSDKPISDAEKELIRRQVAKDITEHSRTRGDVPGWMQRWAKDKLEPKVNWKRQLTAAVRTSINDIQGRTDYSYKKPSRRSSALPDVVMPSMRHPVPKVFVQIDTSGSISDKMLSRAVAETGSVLKSMELRDGVTVLTIDAAVGFCKKVFRPEQIKLPGGGGTDMGVGIRRVTQMKRHEQPDILIILTDGYTPWPVNKPRFNVIIGRLSEGDVPKWATRVIDIRD